MSPPAPPARLPRQIWFLAWNEAAERFSFYGMSSILTLHMVRHLGLADHQAVAGSSLFKAAVYLTPLLGALIADVFWGRYRTILWLSLGYVAGHAVLALWESPTGLVVGLALIAAGAGGIKPCASAFAADQVPPGSDRTVERVYNLYYWMINLGSTVATLTIPKIFDLHGPRLAFAIPGVAMALALLIFVAGRSGYVRLPPTRSRQSRPAPGPGLAASLRAVGWIALVFAPVSVFWALYFQYDSAWTLQADKMDRLVAGLEISAGQMTTLNAVLILLLIPLFTMGVYPGLGRLGVRVTPLRKMSVGLLVTVLSFLAAALVEARMQAGAHPTVLAQVPQYLFMGVGEVLVSVTALEFAYTQAPASMKSFIMGLWFLTISAGSLLAAAVAWLNRFGGASYYHFYAWLMLGAALLFAVIAWRYPSTTAGPAQA